MSTGSINEALYERDVERELKDNIRELERYPNKFFDVLRPEILCGTHPGKDEAEISLRALWLLWRRNDSALTGHERAIGKYMDEIMTKYAQWKAEDDAADMADEAARLRLGGAL